MKLQDTPKFNLNGRNNSNIKSQTSQVAFKGAEVIAAQALRFLETNQAWGASAVDAGCMVAPRTAVDFKRGPAAGIETFRREASGTTNHMLIGVYGASAAWMLSQALNNKFEIKANKMFVSDEMIDIMGNAWHEQVKAKAPEPLKAVLTDVIGRVHGFNPKSATEGNGWVKIGPESKEIAEEFAKEITAGGDAIRPEAKNALKAFMATSLGAENKVKIEKAESSLDAFIDNVYKLAKTFTKKKVSASFNPKELVINNEFLNGLKKLNKYTSIAGLATAVAVGVSVQPLNMYLTKRKTGQSGFVGGGKEDKSKSFKVMKFAAAGAGAYAILSNISAKLITSKAELKSIMKAVQFKGLIPSINQFKLIYGMTLVSRLLSARNKNELRESSTKDTLGFINWLILGGFVSKLTAAGIEKFKNDGTKFIKYSEAENGKGWFNWLTKSSIVTRDEVLYEAIAKDAVAKGKLEKAIKAGTVTFKEMMNIAPEAAKTKIKYLNLIQLAGYLYSGIVLGVGIPKLNIAITKALSKKQPKDDAIVEKKETAITPPASVLAEAPKTTADTETSLIKQKILSSQQKSK